MEISFLADKVSEAPKIAKWYYNEWGKISPSMTEDIVLKDIIEKSINRKTIPLFLVAHADNELIGVLELKFRENKNYPEYEYWVGGVFTCPSHRGKGVASRLLAKAKILATEFNIDKLYLQCESHNVPLYIRNGFSILHHAKHHNIETTIMVWDVIT